MHLSRLLLPLSWLYGAGVALRNLAFRLGLLTERRFPALRTLCVGNLAVGGTGKTPHTEWLVRQMLRLGRDVAVLSRGYGRRTKGFRLVTPDSTAAEVGDEPLQIFRKFHAQGVTVAVCESRCEGLERLQQMHEAAQGTARRAKPLVVLLDDAYQHRYVHPDLSLLLTAFSRPYADDALLPAGRLREPAHAARRASVIVVTKCPPTLTDAQRADLIRRLHPEPWQHVRFTTLVYAPLVPLVENETPFYKTDAPSEPDKKPLVNTGGASNTSAAPSVLDKTPLVNTGGASNASETPRVLLLTAIANPAPLEAHIREWMSAQCTAQMSEQNDIHAQCTAQTSAQDGILERLTYRDHHAFTARDVQHLIRRAESLRATHIITTEKDAVRLYPHLDAVPSHLRARLFVQPVEIRFL